MGPDIAVMSRRLAAEYVYDGPWAAVSIATEAGEWPLLSEGNRVGLLQLHFWDMSNPAMAAVEGFRGKLFGRDDARQILDFVGPLWPKLGVLLVHCEAGISRSPATAGALAHVFEGEGAERSWFERFPFLNRWVYQTILNEHYGHDRIRLGPLRCNVTHHGGPAPVEEALDEPWDPTS